MRGGGSSPRGCLKNIGQPVADVLQEKHPNMGVPPVEKPTCAALEEYEEVLETVPPELSEDDVTWVASSISGTNEALGVEAPG